MEKKLKMAGDAYLKGCTCSQAVFCAFAEDMNLDKITAYKIMEGFGCGCGAMQEVCGAAAVISHYTSSGSMDGKSKGRTYKAQWSPRSSRVIPHPKVNPSKCLAVLFLILERFLSRN